MCVHMKTLVGHVPESHFPAEKTWTVEASCFSGTLPTKASPLRPKEFLQPRHPTRQTYSRIENNPAMRQHEPNRKKASTRAI